MNDEIQDWIANSHPHEVHPPTCLDCDRALTDGRRWLCSTCCPGPEARELRADELREQRDTYNRFPQDSGPERWEDGYPELAAELDELERAQNISHFVQNNV